MKEFGQDIYKNISKRATLLLANEENKFVDFKREIKKLDQEDFVAFANTETGGTIMIGVDEKKDDKGVQHPLVVGCSVSDDIKLMINNKAFSCYPPVDISIHVENASKLPFYRVEVLPGKHKPYCTQSGVYKVRQDGRNRALTPKELLQMFLSLESESFLHKFKEATLEMRGQLATQNQELMSKMWDMAFEMEINMDRVVQELGTSLGEVFEQVTEASDNIREFYSEMQQETEVLKQDVELNYDIKEKLNVVDRNVINLAWKLNALLEHHQIEDPEIAKPREELKAYLRAMKKMKVKYKVKPDKAFFEGIYAACSPIIKSHYKLEDIERWFKEASVE